MWIIKAQFNKFLKAFFLTFSLFYFSNRPVTKQCRNRTNRNVSQPSSASANHNARSLSIKIERPIIVDLTQSDDDVPPTSTAAPRPAVPTTNSAVR